MSTTTKRILIAIVVVFIARSILDFLIHGLLLMPVYAATPGLWRPVNEMNRPLMSLVTLVTSACFVTIYGCLIGRKSLISGLRFGAVFGLASGASMGFGSFCVMPISQTLACGWFIGSWVESVVAGALVGTIVKPTLEND